ncbi:MAG: hypothetical protein ABI675_06575 [Chitinophagaceae bacterium]
MLFGDTDNIGLFEKDEERYEAAVVDMKFGFVMQHRPSLLEKDKKMRPVEQSDAVQVCDARDDDQ